MSELPERKYFDHKVPFWVDEDTLHPAFFITVCCSERGVNQLAVDDVWLPLVESIEHYQRQEDWTCLLFLAMPDHVHGIFRFEGEQRMEAVLKNWKRWTSRRLGIQWQGGFFEHRLRAQESAVEKRNYILNNPVRAGLVKTVKEWRFVYPRLEE